MGNGEKHMSTLRWTARFLNGAFEMEDVWTATDSPSERALKRVSKALSTLYEAPPEEDNFSANCQWCKSLYKDASQLTVQL